jgi:ATP-dependent DNA helicase RecG
LVEKRRARDLPFDLRPFPSASIADLDLDLFLRSYLPSEQGLEVIEQNRRTTEQQLASVRFVTPPPEFIPTALGLLMVGKRPRDFLAGHYVQFLRIDGTELTDPAKDEKELDGPIVELLRVLEEVLRAHIAVAVDYASASLEIKTPDYPVRALEQIVRNAIMHRTYESSHAPVRILWFSDRIEVHNPGGPYGQVTVEHFGEPGRTDYRNPHLSACLKSLGYVQKFGVGIQLAREELEKNGNLPLEFQVDPAHICAVLRRRT